MKNPSPIEPGSSRVGSLPGAEPVRLLAGGGGAFERRLLGSVAGQRISDASAGRLAHALKVPQEPTGVSPAENPSRGALPRPCAEASLLGRLVTVVAVGSVGLIAAILVSRGPEAAVSESPPLAIDERALAAEARTVLPSEAAAQLTVANDRVESARAEASPRPLVRASAVKANVPRGAAPTPVAVSVNDLRAELRLLEAAQAALRGNRANDAARLLDDYARRFPNGELRLEAELLGVDVSLARGDRARALASARELLGRPGAAQYRERLDALLNEARHVTADVQDTSGRGSKSRTGRHEGVEVTE
jgi:hypothetical protein